LGYPKFVKPGISVGKCGKKSFRAAAYDIVSLYICVLVAAKRKAAKANTAAAAAAAGADATVSHVQVSTDICQIKVVFVWLRLNNITLRVHTSKLCGVTCCMGPSVVVVVVFLFFFLLSLKDFHEKEKINGNY